MALLVLSLTAVPAAQAAVLAGPITNAANGQTPLPLVVTRLADQFMPGSARLNGVATPSGSPTLAWFEWGSSLAYGNVTPSQTVGSGTNVVGFSNVLGGLISGTDYHFRARASNAFGVAAGLDQTFNLSTQRPVVTTVAADQLTTNNVRLKGQVNPRGWPTAAWFEWGTTTNYGNQIGMQDVGQDSSVSNLNVVLNGLMSGENYHYRLVATNAFGAVYGANQIFNLVQGPINYGIFGNAAFVASSPNASGDIVIASTYNGYPVTSIAGYAFAGCTNLMSVTIPDSVSIISWYAFSGATSLTNATILGGVGYLGEDAFQGCTSLRSVTIPHGLPRIELRTFYGCTSLASVTIPSDVNSIHDLAFYGCASLTNVTIPDNVNYVGSHAFGGCASLTRVTIPPSVTRIGYEAFMNCTKVTNLTFLGHAPALTPYPTNSIGRWFVNVGAGAKAYYSCGTTGWGTGYGGLPTVMLCAPQVAPGSAGTKPDGFGFTLTRLTNQTIAVEASTDLANWQPIWTNSLPGASADFVDPEWLQHSNRFYRARSD